MDKLLGGNFPDDLGFKMKMVDWKQVQTTNRWCKYKLLGKRNSLTYFLSEMILYLSEPITSVLIPYYTSWLNMHVKTTRNWDSSLQMLIDFMPGCRRKLKYINHWGIVGHMVTWIWVNIGTDNGLLPDGPTSHHLNQVDLLSKVFCGVSEQFHKKCSWT